ncbi:adenylate kinase [Neoconidiobolus thromboides FSU 785]|nr:adenylate kinase [Neoconidiobolus thromboides FSU 785]
MAQVVDHSPLRMLLIGAPGSGKGTQSTRIHQEFGLKTISSGDVLRKHVNEGTHYGKLAKDIISQGALVPDDIMISILKSELTQLIDQSWLLDGFPRNVSQAQALDGQLSNDNTEVNLVVHLDVPEEIILNRIIDRWVHIPSGRVYNLSYNPPKVAGYDDITGEKLVKREDDNPITFKKRLDQFKQLTNPLLEYYDKRNVLLSFKGETSDIIYPQIQKVVGNRMLTH